MEEHPYITPAGLTTYLDYTEVEVSQLGCLPGGVYFPESRSIICGTFPPRGEYYNRIGYFYFSSPHNQFWHHIDALYGTNLFLAGKNDKARIRNARAKIAFSQENEIGFIDIFTRVTRRYEESSDDKDLIEPYESIFANNTFQSSVVNHSVRQFVFVYSTSESVFKSNLETQYQEYQIFQIRSYKDSGLLLGVDKLSIFNREIFLTYCPIHGPNKWELKQNALRKALNFEFDI